MTVAELIIELESKNKNDEVFMFFKTSDGKCFFTSDITKVSNGAIVNEYAQLEKGVLIMKE